MTFEFDPLSFGSGTRDRGSLTKFSSKPRLKGVEKGKIVRSARYLTKYDEDTNFRWQTWEAPSNNVNCMRTIADGQPLLRAWCVPLAYSAGSKGNSANVRCHWWWLCMPIPPRFYS